MRKLVLTLITLSTCFSSFCQDTKLTNTLLWRISGNGLEKPSYLYGTMHLSDKRVFQLGDSVYKALENSDGFAAELDMNNLGMQMINQFIKENEEKASEEPVKIKEAVSEETWNQYKEQLEKKFNKKADKITVDDLEDLEARLQTELIKKGDMPTFLDAWLSGLARKQGKWVGGIEDLEDQLEHIDNIESKIQMALFDDNYFRGSLDWLVKIYTGQKLDSIDAFLYREEDGKKDYIMIKRNLKMARRMDSLSAIRSTLFAIGAAHLPGDSGVIALLRSRGFSVNPIISSKKINPDKYVAKNVEVPWVPVSITDSIYALQMPGPSEGLSTLENMGLDMKMYFDMSFMKLYMTFGIELPEERMKLGQDSLYKIFSSRFSEKGNVINERKVIVNGEHGVEYRISTDDGEMKLQLFMPRSEWVIFNMAFGFNDKSLNDSESERFFQSFAFNSNARKPVAEEKVWKNLVNPSLSFSVKMPVQIPKEKRQVNAEEGKIQYEWQAVDIKDQIFYGISITAMKEGMYNSASDSIVFFTIKEGIKQSYLEGRVTDSSSVIIDSYPGYKLTIIGKSDDEILEIKILLVSRGGLSYYLFSVYPPNDEKRFTADKFLNSFKLDSYNYPEWKTVTSPDGSFTTTLPHPLTKKELEGDDENGNLERFLFYDSIAFVTSYIDKLTIPDWFWYSTDTGFLRFSANLHKSWDDSIINYTLSTVGDQKTVSFDVVKHGNSLVKKVKLTLNGNQLYEVYGNYAQQDAKNNYNVLFNDFRILNKKTGWTNSNISADKLGEALRNPDTKLTKEVNYWWNALEFSAADIPTLQKMALQIYPDFDSTYYNNLNRNIFDKLSSLDSNNTTVGFIQKNYGSIEAKDEYIKPYIISYLSGIQTTESYNVLKECLTNYSFNIEKAPYFYHSLYDSLELTAILYPEVMRLAGVEAMSNLLSGTTTSLLDSSLLTKSVIKEYGSYFITSAKRALDNDGGDIEESPYYYTDLIRILGVINTPETNGLLKRFSKIDNREVKFRTMIAMLENDLPVDNRNFLTFAMIDEYRHLLYDELLRINKLKSFPASYLTQKHLGQSKLFVYAIDEDYEPEQVSYVAERTILYKGQQQKFYLFKVSYSDEEESTYFGVAGPYSTNSKILSSTHDVTGIYWEGKFDSKNLDTLLKEYLESLEDENSEEE